MARGTVLAVDAQRRLFALQIADGRSTVFSQHSGPCVEVGHLLVGNVGVTGFRLFAHSGGFCRAFDEAGPLATTDALAVVRVSGWPQPAPAAADNTGGVPSPLTQGSHVDRIVFS